VAFQFVISTLAIYRAQIVWTEKVADDFQGIRWFIYVKKFLLLMKEDLMKEDII